ncbi:hypothetical protein Bca101_058720 [Brassica carinata]
MQPFSYSIQVIMDSKTKLQHLNPLKSCFLSSFKSFATQKHTRFNLLWWRKHQRWTGDTIAPYTAAEYDGERTEPE